MGKKIYPKIKKSLKGFLTDESGKVTKKDVLGISSGALILGGSGFEAVDAAFPPCTEISYVTHTSTCSTTVSQPAISGYSGGSHVSQSLVGGSIGYSTSGTQHANAVGGHGNASAPANGTLYSSGGHMSYTSRGGSISQPAISGYSHSSGNTHTNFITPGICP